MLLLSKLLLLLLVANGTPVLATRLLGERMAMPLDHNRPFFDGQPLFGVSKTLRGVLLAPLATTVTAMLCGLLPEQGLVVGSFAMLGDLFSSFIKRRLKLPSGSKATLLDQIPESLLPLFVYNLYWDLGWLSLLFLCAVFSIIEIFLSPLLFRWGIRSHPH